MHYLTVPITFNSKSECFYFSLITDEHVDTINFQEKLYNKNIRYLDKLESENPGRVKVIKGGDCIEGITMRDPRFDSRNISGSLYNLGNVALQGAKKYYRLVKPIKRMIIGSHCGNHEEKLRKNSSIDILEGLLCDPEYLNSPFLGKEALITFKFKFKNYTRNFVVYSGHGEVTGKGALNSFADSVILKHEADLYIVGHSHFLDYTIRNRNYTKNTGDGVLKEKYCVMSGSYLKNSEKNVISYGDKYPHTICGSALIKIKPFSGKVVDGMKNEEPRVEYVKYLKD